MNLKLLSGERKGLNNVLLLEKFSNNYVVFLLKKVIYYGCRYGYLCESIKYLI